MDNLSPMPGHGEGESPPPVFFLLSFIALILFPRPVLTAIYSPPEISEPPSCDLVTARSLRYRVTSSESPPGRVTK